MLRAVLRTILIINLVAASTFTIVFGTPLGTFHKASLQDFVDDWWLASTATILILFSCRVVRRIRGSEVRGLGSDALLVGTWVCVFVAMIFVGMAQFAGF